MLFESRDTRLAGVRWHPRFKERCRSKADAQRAKEAWEQKGKILFPADIEKPKAKARVKMRARVKEFHELRV